VLPRSPSPRLPGRLSESGNNVVAGALAHQHVVWLFVILERVHAHGNIRAGLIRVPAAGHKGEVSYKPYNLGVRSPSRLEGAQVRALE